MAPRGEPAAAEDLTLRPPTGMTDGQGTGQVSMCFLGFGDLAVSWAAALRGRDWIAVSAYLPAASASRRHPGWDDRVMRAGVSPVDDLAAAVDGADVLIAAVPARVSPDVATACFPHMGGSGLYVDPSPAAPNIKSDICQAALEQGVSYVDLALLGTVTMSGLEVPLLAAGPRADSFLELGRRLGMQITKVSDQAGDATRVKLVRSVYMKGRDALIVELLIAANLIGAERVLVDSISGAPGEQVSFAELVDRVLPALAKHAERRADELNDTGAVLRELGLDPIMVEAAERRLRWMADHTAADTPRSEQLSAVDIVAGLLGRARTDP
jgi:3-hydroxyisobutyrate dehydrogenase-like beta-hydroxyacid dehydrogenase